MQIPFLHYFTKRKTEKQAETPAAPPPPPLEKPSSERLSKTVMPSSARNGAQNGASAVATEQPVSSAAPAVSTLDRRDSAPAPAVSAPSTAPRTISFNSPAPSRSPL